jgi:glutamate-1-semialdehyde aminotransferase
MKALKKLKKEGEYEKLNERTSKYAREIETLFKRRGIGCHVNTAGSHYKVHFTEEEPTFDVVCRLDKRFLYLFNVALMTKGVLLASPSSGSGFVSFATTDEDLANILEAMEATLNRFGFAGIIE